jgi:hypothetical protein
MLEKTIEIQKAPKNNKNELTSNNNIDKKQNINRSKILRKRKELHKLIISTKIEKNEIIKTKK